MPSDPASTAVDQNNRKELLLWASLLLSPLAMGVNTIVGYTVAHWVCDVNRKRTSFLVSAIDFILCLGALGLAIMVDRHLPTANDSEPHPGRRRFMARIAMLLAILSILLVIAQTLAVITLRPCD